MPTENGKKISLLVCFVQVHIGGAMTSFVNFVNALDTRRYDVDVMFAECKKGERYGIKEGIHILEQGQLQWSNWNVRFRKLASPSYYAAKAKQFYYKKCAHQLKPAWQTTAKQGSRYSVMLEKHYDAAVAFEMGWPMYYVNQYVKADKKLQWFHNDYDAYGYHFVIDKPTFDTTDRLVFVSEECRRKFIESYPAYKDRSVFMPNLMASDYLRKKAEEPISLPYSPKDGKLTFVSVARINFEEKGFDRAIQVFARLRDDGLLNDARWLVVGDGRDTDAFKKLVKELKLENFVCCVGMQTNPFPYMKTADILYLPSRNEGKPMVVTEGYILGLVPVVTRYTSASGQIRDGVDGLIFENNAEALYEGLKKLLADRGVLQTLKQTIDAADYGNEKQIDIFDGIITELLAQ